MNYSVNYTNIAIAFGFVLLLAIALKINEWRKSKLPKEPPVVTIVSIGSAEYHDFKTLKGFFASLPKNLKKENKSYIAEIHDDASSKVIVNLSGIKTDQERSITIRPARGVAFEDRPGDK